MSTGRWTRARFGAQAVLAALLAVVAALFAVEVADWRFVRVDLSSARKNSLDPAVLDVIDKLPEKVTVDVFFRPLFEPYGAVSRVAQQRVLEYLQVVAQARRDKLEVLQHDPSAFEATQARLSALGVEGSHKVVLSCGERRAVLELYDELTLVDWGNPSPEAARRLYEHGIAVNPNKLDPRAMRPAQFLEFRGEEPFVQALLKVSSGSAPRVYFVEGHGEPDPASGEPGGLMRLVGALRADGFEVDGWDPVATAEVPSDCEVLLLIGPTQPYLARTRETIARWIQEGGQVLVAPDRRELGESLADGLGGLLANFGIVLARGVACLPLKGFDGLPVESLPECADLVIDDGLMPGSPLTEPLRMRGRYVRFIDAGAFQAGGLEKDVGVLLPLVQTKRESWRDLDGDFRANPARGETRERLTLATVKQLPAKKRDDGSVQQGRILAVGAASFFANGLFDSNRDFALNAVNWLAEREYRIKVAPLPRGESFLDFQRSAARPVLTYGLGFALPGLSVLVGVLVFLRRRR